MLEYSDYIDIIDYKLKNVADLEYVKQLKGYQEYISKKPKRKLICIYIQLLMLIIKK